MNEKSTDFTKKCIMESLLILMQKKDFHAISIREIAEKAGVGRVTVYRHFLNKEAIILYHFRLQGEKYYKETENILRLLENHTALFCAMFELIERNKEHILNIINSHIEYLYLDYLNESFKKMFYERFQLENTFLQYARAGALYNLSLQWVKRGCKESAKEMAETYYKILFQSPFGE